MADTIKSMPSSARLKFQDRIDKIREAFFAAAGVCVFLLPAVIPDDEESVPKTPEQEIEQAALWVERQGCDPAPIYQGKVPDCSKAPIAE